MKAIRTMLSALLCVTMLSTNVFAADAYSLYKGVLEELDTVTSMDVSGTAKVSLSGGARDSQDIDYTENFSLQILYPEANKMEFTYVTKDGDHEIGKYYKDGVLYEFMDGAETKRSKKTKSEVVSSLPLSLNIVSKEGMEDLTVKDVEGGRQISFKMKKYSTTSTISYTMVVDDSGSLVRYQSKFRDIFDWGSGSFSSKYDVNAKIHGINTLSKLSFPAGI